MTTIAKRKPKLPMCEQHPDTEMVQTPYKQGNRFLLACPVPQCGNLRVKPRPTPKKAKELELTTVPLSEHEEQCRLIQEARAHIGDWPDLSVLIAIPNGGLRHITVAARLKAEGVREGVSDLFLPCAAGRYHGLWIEMKTLTGHARVAQKQWQQAMRSRGYACETCRGWKAAWTILINYLAGTYEPQ